MKGILGDYRKLLSSFLEAGYEYSFFNIPTVCTYWDEVSMFTETIFLAKDKYEFSDHINFLINEKSINNRLNVDLSKRDWHQNLKRVI